MPQPGADAHHARLEKIASKEVPYNAKKLGANVMLNNRVSTLQWDGATPYVERVVCRHFAQEFVEATGRKRKLMEFLARNGFGYDVINTVIQKVLTVEENEISDD